MPVCTTSAVILRVALISVSCKLVAPVTTVFPVTLKLLSSSTLPWARNSKLLLLFVVVITLSNISMSVELTMFSSATLSKIRKLPNDAAFADISWLTIVSVRTTFPVPLASNVKSFDELSVITLFSKLKLANVVTEVAVIEPSTENV